MKTFATNELTETQITAAQPPHPTVMLFDIDGTLIDSNGAGGKALLAAIQMEFKIARPQPVVLHGRTDAGIVAEMLTINGLAATADNFQRLCQGYLKLLPLELQRRGGKVLPGVSALLARLRRQSGCHLGLLTGNLPQSARMKLEHFGLWDWFEFGIFGDQVAHRPHLADPARREANYRSGRELPAEQIIVIGDTPLGVELALALRARCLGVATGGFGISTLLAAGACHAVEDLSQTSDIFDWIFNQTELK